MKNFVTPILLYRSSLLMLLLLISGGAIIADEKDWTGKTVQFKDEIKLGRPLGGGLARDGAVLDKSKTYVVKTDDGTYLELVGQVGFVFKSEAQIVAVPAKPNPITGTFKWYTDAEFVFREDGTATAKLGTKTWEARWVTNPYGGYVLMYADGGVDLLKLVDAGKKLEGTGVNEGKSYPVSGIRQK